MCMVRAASLSSIASFISLANAAYSLPAREGGFAATAFLRALMFSSTRASMDPGLLGSGSFPWASASIMRFMSICNACNCSR
jgi:hypothetical protein